MRSPIRPLSLIATVSAMVFGIQPATSAMPAILMTHDVGSEVNVRAQPTTQADIVHRGVTGTRLDTLGATSGEDGFVWYNVQFEESGIRGWVRADLLQLGTHEPPIRSGRYWVGPVGMGLEVRGDQYRYYDETGEEDWRSIDDLQYVTDGVVQWGDYWCHADLPEPEVLPGQSPGISLCTADGWNYNTL